MADERERETIIHTDGGGGGGGGGLAIAAVLLLIVVVLLFLFGGNLFGGADEATDIDADVQIDAPAGGNSG